jgi:hypothetical protein
MKSTRINISHNIMNVITHKISNYHFHQSDARFEVVFGVENWTPTSGGGNVTSNFKMFACYNPSLGLTTKERA